MLARGRIRSQMYFGVTTLVVIVTVLSAASIHGSLKFRRLTKSIRNRATELPLAANLSQKVSDLRSAFWQQTTYEKKVGVYQPATLEDHLIAPISFLNKLQAAKNALKDYQTRLENVNSSGELLGGNQKELEFASNFELSLKKIEQIVNERDWVLTPSNRSIGEIKEELEKLQEGTSQLPGLMNNRMNAFASKARRDYNSWMVLSALASVGAFMMIFVLYQRFNKRIFRPLDTLVEGSRRVARGDFGYRIRLKTNDEVAELGDALNAMTSNFQEIKSDLNRQVKQRTKEVVRSEKMASVGFLAAGVAHEINNPLATIAWSAESLESRIQDILNPQVSLTVEQRQAEIDDMKKYLQRIQEEAFRCKGITSGLLDFSRMGDVKKVPTNLYEIIESVIEMVSPLSKYRDRNIHFDGDVSIRATVNAQEMKQVTLNLITNALSCVAPGGDVRIKLEKQADNAVLSIVDNGCGMTEDVMRHLFEPFFTRRRDEQGTGLGLSITYQIIEDHGGRIVPQSDGPGRGSSFTVSLPLVKNEQHETAKAA